MTTPKLGWEFALSKAPASDAILGDDMGQDTHCRGCHMPRYRLRQPLFVAR